MVRFHFGGCIPTKSVPFSSLEKKNSLVCVGKTHISKILCDKMARVEADFVVPGIFVGYAWKSILGTCDRVICGVELELDDITRLCKGDVGVVVEVAATNANGVDDRVGAGGAGRLG